MFYVGQKVVCVSFIIWEGSFYGSEQFPIPKQVYTIRDLFTVQIHGREEYLLRLMEVRNPPMSYKIGNVECGFLREHFRPLVERKTDISIFKKLLAPTEREKERA